MALFLSTFINKIDKKGRVSVPSTFRAVLAQESFAGIIAFRSYKLEAIEACGMSRMQSLSKSVDHFDLFSDTHDDLAATIFADAHQLMFDGEGRIMLPETLLAHAGLDDRVAFVGRGATFQLWQPERFEKHQQEARLRMQQNPISLRLHPTSAEKETP